jgi:hypothetical protein
MEYDWYSINNAPSRSYRCGYCSNSLSSEKAYYATIRLTNTRVYVYVCHFCGKPTFFDFDGGQTPGPIYGQEVSGIEDEKIKKLYTEARKCIGAGAPTSAILACRKLLMHVAVEKGAGPNLKFIEYVEYLSTKGYIPPDSKEWVDEIRERGNEATHEIVIMSEGDAKDLIQLTEMLLKIIYQFPSEIKQKRATKATPTK